MRARASDSDDEARAPAQSLTLQRSNDWRATRIRTSAQAHSTIRCATSTCRRSKMCTSSALSGPTFRGHDRDDSRVRGSRMSFGFRGTGTTRLLRTMCIATPPSPQRTAGSHASLADGRRIEARCGGHSSLQWSWQTGANGKMRPVTSKSAADEPAPRSGWAKPEVPEPAATYEVRLCPSHE